jgi:tRNA pseudouridine38-40 synthase
MQSRVLGSRPSALTMPERLPATQEPAPQGSGLLRIRVDLAYDGSQFSGWAAQPGRRTVQGELQTAFARVLRVPDARIVVAGRTDAGVHSLGQVCHADIPEQWWPGGELCARRLNAVLPPDVRVRACAPAPPGFHARFSAQHRRYHYLISDSGRLDPRARNAVLLRRRALDAALMHRAGQALVGEHDFSAFCRARPGASAVRTVLSLSVSRTRDPRDPRLLGVDIAADAFCHSMVRSIVGALMAVGEGRLAPAELADILAARLRTPKVPTAPAHGLALVEVGYPSDADLAEQARRARRYRG